MTKEPLKSRVMNPNKELQRIYEEWSKLKSLENHLREMKDEEEAMPIVEKPIPVIPEIPIIPIIVKNPRGRESNTNTNSSK